MPASYKLYLVAQFVGISSRFPDDTLIIVYTACRTRWRSGGNAALPYMVRCAMPALGSLMSSVLRFHLLPGQLEVIFTISGIAGGIFFDSIYLRGRLPGYLFKHPVVVLRQKIYPRSILKCSR